MALPVPFFLAGRGDAASGAADAFSGIARRARPRATSLRAGACGIPLASSTRMLDRTLGGIRCRSIRVIAHHGGYLPRAVEGTVVYATENIGRTLLRVAFDSGQTLMVLPEDVVLETTRGDELS